MHGHPQPFDQRSYGGYGLYAPLGTRSYRRSAVRTTSRSPAVDATADVVVALLPAEIVAPCVSTAAVLVGSWASFLDHERYPASAVGGASALELHRPWAGCRCVSWPAWHVPIV
ncbi:hypothetical protein [Kibdelosporangium philippinense]|uniref:hypothetical protein n=1 Tax=Kibdelosporangium philippinense TaxID=211113 RepID=UPI0036196A2A